MKRTLWLVGLLLCLASSAISVGQTPSIANGSFEIDPFGYIGTLGLGCGNTLTGWTTQCSSDGEYPWGLPNINTYNGGPTPYGNQWVIIGDFGNDDSYIQQAVSGFTVSQMYTLNFALASEGIGAGSQIQVSFPSGSSTPSQTFTAPSRGANYWDTWAMFSLQFLATNSTVTIRFTALADGSALDVGLDNVSLGNALSLMVTPNVDCDLAWLPCSGNIVLANGSETTKLSTMVSPPQAISVMLSTDFGNVSNVQTDNSGEGIGTYTAGTLPFGFDDTTTTVATIAGAIGTQQFPSLTQIFNYAGFNFHQSQVTDAEFTDRNALSVSDIQSFFETSGSFMSKFILISSEGGFIDSNSNGKLDAGETVYISSPPRECLAPCGRFRLGSTGTAASAVFKSAAARYGLNPKVLIATSQKENSLISDKRLPQAATLNFAMGCGQPSDFLTQLNCSAMTFIHQFMRSPPEPVFLDESTYDIQHYVTNLGRQAVAFQVQTAATYAQYRYTPFIQAGQSGGGVYLFEQIWSTYGF